MAALFVYKQRKATPIFQETEHTDTLGEYCDLTLITSAITEEWNTGIGSLLRR